MKNYHVFIQYQSVRFTVGVQTFTLDYGSKEPEDLEWMKTMLEMALENIEHDRPQ